MPNEQAPHLQAFLDAADYFVGLKEYGENTFRDPRGKELWNLWGWNASGTAWCAIFASACAVKAGISGVVIAKDSYAIGIQKKTVEQCGGTWIDGPLINGGVAVTPQPGDLITFGEVGYCGHNKAKHVGIVEKVEGGRVHTIEGNSSDQCQRNDYDLGYEKINAYVRPDWSRVGDIVTDHMTANTPAEITYTPLYNSQNDRHDMSLREVCYLNNNYSLSNSDSSIAISVINYTTIMGTLYDSFASAYANNIMIDTSQLMGNTKIAVDYCLSMGYTASASCAIAGCLYAYSGIDPSYCGQVSGKYLYGIGAWENYDMNKSKARSGRFWNTDLSAQLEFLLYDLYLNYKELVFVIKSKPLNAEGVTSAVELFMKLYNPNFSEGDYVSVANGFAIETYNNLIITQTQVIGNTADVRDINGNILEPKYSIQIPDYVTQTGIIDDYTSYSKWFNKWNKRSPQKKLALIWGDQRLPCDKGIATIGGYYCCAVRPKFGRCGEIIVVTLEDGTTFTGIICDEKGDDAGSEWGHKKAGGTSLIEWERVKTKPVENGHMGERGVIVNSDLKPADVDDKNNPQFTDWLGKKVLSITNYGEYVHVEWS